MFQRGVWRRETLAESSENFNYAHTSISWRMPETATDGVGLYAGSLYLAAAVDGTGARGDSRGNTGHSRLAGVGGRGE